MRSHLNERSLLSALPQWATIRRLRFRPLPNVFGRVVCFPADKWFDM